MLDSICASKLYRASTRKSRINAAFDDPINSELVGQLAKALDEEYQTRDFLVKDRTEPERKDTTSEESSMPDSFGISDNATASAGHSPMSGKPSGPPKKQDSDPNPDQDLQDSSSEPGSPTNPPVDAGADNAPSGIEEATKMSGERIVGSQIRCEFADMRQTADQIKGMLNFKDSTKGVSRILCKENELWIYYNDDINLNNVMAEVIELINAANYVYLEFNRLARSDNAIVFQVDFRNTDMQPIKLQTSKE